jgi:hypothetical protein
MAEGKSRAPLPVDTKFWVQEVCGIMEDRKVRSIAGYWCQHDSTTARPHDCNLPDHQTHPRPRATIHSTSLMIPRNLKRFKVQGLRSILTDF